jgi:hypothetical protein
MVSAVVVMLVDRADALMGCTENSPEETELAALTDGIAHSGEGGQGFRSIPDSNPTEAGQ